MLREYIENIVEGEILNNLDFINIDRSDIDYLKKDVDKVELELIVGSIDVIVAKFKAAILRVTSEKSQYKLSKLLFVIKTSDKNSTAINDVSFVDSMLEECDCDIIWGVSIDGRIPQDEVKIIMLFGLNQ